VSAVKPVSPPGMTAQDDPGNWVTYLYTCFLQGLFNHFAVGSYRWEPAVRDSDIVITGESPVEQADVQQWPHLVVLATSYQNSNLALDHMRDQNMMTGARVHTDLLAGHFTVHCVGTTGLEARRLAGLVWRGTIYHRRLLQKTGGFHHIGTSVTVGPEAPPGALVRGSSTVEAVVVDVLVPWFFQWTWSVELLAPPQKTTLGFIFDEPRASDYEKPPFDVLNDAKILAHYGVANRGEVEAQFGMRGIEKPQ